MSDLLDLVYTPKNQWDSAARNAFDIALKARFLRVGDLTHRKGDEKRFQLRVKLGPKGRRSTLRRPHPVGTGTFRPLRRNELRSLSGRRNCKRH